MSLASTHFNPFGESEKTVKAVKAEMEEIAENLKQGGDLSRVVKDVKKYEHILEKVTEVAASLEAHAIKALISEIAMPFSSFIADIGKRNTDQSKSININILARRVTRFMQTIADRVVEPYSSELLEEWSPVFKAFLTSNQHSFKENGALLWKRTFGSIKTPLEWPSDLRSVLEQVPKKHGIVLPPASKFQSSYMIDDDAMDGLPMCPTDSVKNFKPPGVTKEGAGFPIECHSSSFQLSQQPAADAVADKILSDRKLLENSPKPNSVNTPPRKRAAKISLFDEDSCSYIPVTPTSGRKNRLTDRQKEKLAEAAGPSTSINYMNEESQSSFQKTEKLKEALSEMFDVGEDSCSQPCTKVAEKVSIQIDDMDATSSQSLRRASKRSRKLFSDSPVKALPTSSSCNMASIIKTELSESASEVSPKPPTTKKSKSGRSDNEDIGSIASVVKPTPAISDSTDDVVMERIPQIIEDNTPQKKRGRPKTTPKQCFPANSASARKSSSVPLVNEKKIISGKDHIPTNLSTIGKQPEKSTNAIGHDSVIIAPEFKVSPIGNLENSFPEIVPMNISETLEIAKSPPKTPRTPSILRAAKGVGGPNSPITDRKKNRVHFDAECLPKESSASPPTPRRRPVTEDPVPIRCGVVPLNCLAESTTSKNKILEVPVPIEPTSKAFFPSLANCSEKVDRLIPSLLVMCRKVYFDSAKVSLRNADVFTVGDFAQLPKKKIEEFTWIKMNGAKNALLQFEKKWRAEQFVEEKLNQEKEATANDVDSAEPALSTVSSPTKVTIVETVTTDIKLPKPEVYRNETDFVKVEKDDKKVFEDDQNTLKPATTTPEKLEFLPQAAVSAMNCIDSSDSQKVSTQSAPGEMLSIQKTPEASQSPASPICSATASAASAALETQKDAPTGNSRKNLAPIFLDRASRMKATGNNAQLPAEKTLLNDVRQLSQICLNLITASTQNKFPKENVSHLMMKVQKAAYFFKYFVQERKVEEWEDVEFDILPSTEISVEKEVEKLMIIHKKFLRLNAQPAVDSLPWSSVLESISESACFLEGLVRARNPSISII